MQVLEAKSPRIAEAWIDGTEEVLIVAAVCPQEACGHELYALFFMPRDKEKSRQCPACGAEARLVLPG